MTKQAKILELPYPDYNQDVNITDYFANLRTDQVNKTLKFNSSSLVPKYPRDIDHFETNGALRFTSKNINSLVTPRDITKLVGETNYLDYISRVEMDVQRFAIKDHIDGQLLE